MITRLPDPKTGAPSPVKFPALILLVSGGHNMLVLTRDLGKHTIIGNTLDDSVGEAFDKTARVLGIDAIPGGVGTWGRLLLSGQNTPPSPGGRGGWVGVEMGGWVSPKIQHFGPPGTPPPPGGAGALFLGFGLCRALRPV